MPNTPNQHSGPRRGVRQRGVERDLDLKVLDLLCTSGDFRHWFLGRVADGLVTDPGDACFLGAWHSVSTPNGESDIEIDWECGGTVLSVLIEDKVGAVFQPEQGARYRERADGYRVSGRARATRTVLVAPLHYARTACNNFQQFDRHVPLEHIAVWAETHAHPDRRTYLAQFFRHLLGHPARRGSASFTSVSGSPAGSGKPQYPGFYDSLRSPVELRSLRIGNASASEWVYFKVSHFRRHAELRWRLRDHWAELVLPPKDFTRQSATELLASSPIDGASVASRGETQTVIWLSTPEIDPNRPASEQSEEVDEALDIVRSLHDWAKMNLANA